MRTDKPYISIVINVDSRPERHEFGGENLKGVVNRDFLTHGVVNKIQMFNGFDFETIVFIDQHEHIPATTLDFLHSICDVVCVRKHTHEEKFNDANYLAALQLARGEIVFHFDSDVAAFASSKESIQELIDLLNTHDYVSYPTTFSPNPDNNPNYNYWWCSTRFFLYKRSTLNIPEIEKCLADSEYLYTKYPASIRNPWLEHIIALIAKYTTSRGVYYPMLDYSKLLIFCWDNYRTGLLKELNEMDYKGVKQFVLSNGGIHYPNQVRI